MAHIPAGMMDSPTVARGAVVSLPMYYRTFGRLGWRVSELGYGMWGLAGWTGSDDAESLESLQLAVDSGVNFFDTAAAYGDGHSERILGRLVKTNPEKRLYVATKVPPKNKQWPARRGTPVADVFPRDHIRESVERSLENLGTPSIDLLQFHVWEDDWSNDDGWQEEFDDLRRERLVAGFGISVNRWEPWNGIRALRGGLFDAVQVIYNIFDQSPEDELFPICREFNIGVIARVPFDEGSLTGAITRESTWPAEDYRARYFGTENLMPTMDRVDTLRSLVPAGASLSELALRFILSNPDVSTTIPGMRKLRNVQANVASADAGPLSAELLGELRKHRWDRKPKVWSA